MAPTREAPERKARCPQPRRPAGIRQIKWPRSITGALA